MIKGRCVYCNKKAKGFIFNQKVCSDCFEAVKKGNILDRFTKHKFMKPVKITKELKYRRNE